MFVPFACPPPAESEAELVFIELHPFNRAVHPSHAKRPHFHSAAHVHPSPSPSHRNSPARHGDPPRLQQKQNTTTIIIIITHRKNLKKETQKRTRDTSRALQQLLGMSAYPSCELGISERRHVRHGAFDERESARKGGLGWWGPEPEKGREEKEWFLRYRSSSWSSSRWSVSAALR